MQGDPQHLPAPRGRKVPGGEPGRRREAAGSCLQDRGPPALGSLGGGSGRHEKPPSLRTAARVEKGMSTAPQGQAGYPTSQQATQTLSQQVAAPTRPPGQWVQVL